MTEKETIIKRLEDLLGDGLLAFEHGYNKAPFIGGRKIWGVEFKAATKDKPHKTLIAYGGKRWDLYKQPESKIKEVYDACDEYINRWEF